ncbi:uncharacterized protein LOC122298309 [Carya illinoinensis]|uniref:uncharacterized protein LOC122298309 n=1 Tax=Carya illinoinensis TaxID=32201 RepID=UPI001C728BDA|nr:uncharacterized protein LOC122298309 [Carya illinoinensis]
MAAPDGPPPMAVPARSFADLVSAVPQPLSEMEVSFRQPKTIDGELVFTFSVDEIEKLAQPFRYSIVLKFLKQRPSLDAVRSFIRNRWGLSSMPVVSAMQRPRHVFVRMANEMDFNKALSRESCEVNGTFYRPFAWTPDFDENYEPSCVPVWVFLPGLPPSFYQPSVLKMLTAPIGRFIRCDNSTTCATRTDGARVCLEVDSSKAPINYFWIGKPGVPRSRRQEIIFETLPAYCSTCKCQGHNAQTCRRGMDQKKPMREAKRWVKVDVKPTEERVVVAEPTTSSNPKTDVQPECLAPRVDDAATEHPDFDGKGFLEDEHEAGKVDISEVQRDCTSPKFPRQSLDPVCAGDPSSSNGIPSQENEGGMNLISEMCVEKGAVSYLGLNDREGPNIDLPDFQVTELLEDGSSLNDEVMIIPDSIGEQVERLTHADGDEKGNTELFEETQSDHEDAKISMKEDMRKEYCTDSEGMTKKWLRGSNQFVSVKVEEKGFVFILTIVYAKCNPVERKHLWDDLVEMSYGNLPWLLCGDFNIIREDSERRGGLPRPFSAMGDFNICLQNCGVMDMRSQGASMTWCNGHSGLSRSWARLDRCFLNPNFLNCFPNVFSQVLPRNTSDHAPLVIQMGEDPFRYGPSPFRFQFMWTDHADFLSFVEGIWNQAGFGAGLFKLSSKLKRLKVALRDWNQRVFGRTDVIIKELEQRIDRIENSLQNSYSIEDDNDLLAANLELLTWKGREDIRLSHMAKNRWLKDGDNNSKFFHAYLNAKKQKRVTDMVLADGTHLNNPLEIHKAAVDHFNQFLSENSIRDFPSLQDLISPVITTDENMRLCITPSIDDIKDALFSIPIDSSPGLDGFGSGFFRFCWEIVKEDLLEAVSEFFQHQLLPRYYSASFIVLIPKVDSPTGFDKFRPISLCSVVYKICAKILVSRLTNLLPKMISQEQGAFIPGRSIFENISLTQEMVHSINKTIYGGNVLVKLDMSKAYDRVNWRFLIHVLGVFGFSSQFCDLINLCISSPWYSIMLNGTSLGFFKGERGLRQGDPLSPYLFVIMQEVLSRLLKKAFVNGNIGRFSQARGTPLISHLMYADDIVIFTNGGKKSMRGLMEVLNLYENWTGQVLNKNKSAILFSNKISNTRKSSILRMTGFSEGSFPFKYLGVPIVVGRLKVCDFGDLIGNFNKKIAGWKMKMLSTGGRVNLLRHVLSSMAIHLMAVLHVPNGVYRVLNRIMSSFFWGDVEGKGKRKWVAWKHICHPTEEGGLGIRDFEDVQRALHMKFAWRLLQGHSLWADFFRGKYVQGNHLSLLNPTKGTRFWKAIVHCIPEVLNNSKWLVKEGNVSFWYDNWVDRGPIGDQFPVIERPLLRVKECRIDNGWDITLLERLVGQHKALELFQFLATRKDGQDILIWMKDNNGNFSTKSAWDCIRVKAPLLPWAHWIWHTHVPKKISVMMWKAYHNCLSVDEKIKRIGIPIVSKCNCCARGHLEDLNHVLCTGDFARRMWRLAATHLGVHMGVFHTWKEQINFWFRRAGKSSQLRIIFGILPSIISWQLWNRRCKARVEDKVDSVQSVWYVVKLWIRRIMPLFMKVSRISNLDVDILKKLDIPVLYPKLRQPRVIRWKRPPQDWMKLNSDGSSLGNPGPAGAGGVIRDSLGRIHSAYSVFLGHGSNNYAELRSLLEGVRRCHQFGFRRVEIEIDSQMIVRWCTKGQCTIWYLEDFWEELRGLLGCMEYRLNHVFREGNAVADFLAKMGAGGLTMDWSFNDTLPEQLRGLLRLDRIGLPYLRKV